MSTMSATTTPGIAMSANTVAYPFNASRAWRALPVTAHVTSGTMAKSAAQARTVLMKVSMR